MTGRLGSLLRIFYDRRSRLHRLLNDNPPLSIEETQPDNRTRPSKERPLTTWYPSRQEPCNPPDGFTISEDNVRRPIQETRPDARTRPHGGRHMPTSPTPAPEPGNNMEALYYTVEELDMNMINLNQHRNSRAGCDWDS